jgi:DNA replication licensing factor MCM7
LAGGVTATTHDKLKIRG